MRKAFKLSDEYAARWIDENLYIFSYFEDEGEIRERINAMHLTLGETELRALADEACAAFGGCDFLENARRELPDLLAALERVQARAKAPENRGAMTQLQACRFLDALLAEIEPALAGVRGGG